MGVAGEAGFFGFGELDAAVAEFYGLEARKAVADGAEFGVVHARPAGELEEAKLELLFGEGWNDCAPLTPALSRKGRGGTARLCQLTPRFIARLQ